MSDAPKSALEYTAAAVATLAPERSQSFNTTQVADLALKLNQADVSVTGVGSVALLQAARVGYARQAQSYDRGADAEDDVEPEEAAASGGPDAERAGKPRLTRAINAKRAGQGDFAEFGGTAWGWLRETVSYDDFGNRLAPIYMNHFQYKSRVELMRRQSEGVTANYNRERVMLDKFPEWTKRPEQMLGQLLGQLDRNGKPKL